MMGSEKEGQLYDLLRLPPYSYGTGGSATHSGGPRTYTLALLLHGYWGNPRQFDAITRCLHSRGTSGNADGDSPVCRRIGLVREETKSAAAAAYADAVQDTVEHEGILRESCGGGAAVTTYCSGRGCQGDNTEKGLLFNAMHVLLLEMVPVLSLFLRRLETEEQQQQQQRQRQVRVCFVGHSFGGLVLREVLWLLLVVDDADLRASMEEVLVHVRDSSARAGAGRLARVLSGVLHGVAAARYGTTAARPRRVSNDAKHRLLCAAGEASLAGASLLDGVVAEIRYIRRRLAVCGARRCLVTVATPHCGIYGTAPWYVRRARPLACLLSRRRRSLRELLVVDGGEDGGRWAPLLTRRLADEAHSAALRRAVDEMIFFANYAGDLQVDGCTASLCTAAEVHAWCADAGRGAATSVLGPFDPLAADGGQTAGATLTDARCLSLRACFRRGGCGGGARLSVYFWRLRSSLPLAHIACLGQCFSPLFDASRAVPRPRLPHAATQGRLRSWAAAVAALGRYLLLTLPGFLLTRLLSVCFSGAVASSREVVEKIAGVILDGPGAA